MDEISSDYADLKQENEDLRARIAELEAQLAAAVKLGPHDTKEAFDWALLGKLDELERDAARWKECERLAELDEHLPGFTIFYAAATDDVTFAAAIDASIAARGDG